MCYNGMDSLPRGLSVGHEGQDVLVGAGKVWVKSESLLSKDSVNTR